jgi:hypothetical protein
MDVRAGVREQQAFAASEAGILDHPLDGLSPRAGRSSTPETAFWMWLVECTLRRRYGARPGMVARLERAFAAVFQLSWERVRQLRKLYYPFLPACIPVA